MKKARNKSRKKKPVQKEGFLFVGPVAVILLLVAAVSLSYLHLHNQCDMMGKDILEMEGELQRVKGRALVEQNRWDSLITLEGVQRAVQRHHLNMTWPETGRIVEVKPRNRAATQLAMNPAGATWTGKLMHD